MAKRVAEYDPGDVSAMQFLERGAANDAQQRRALNWILINVCEVYDQSYVPNDTHETAFREGKRYCGNQIIKMLKLEPGKLRRMQDE